MKWAHHCSKVLYTWGAEVTVQLRNKCAALFWQWGSHTREILWVTHVTLVMQYQHFPFHIKYQISCTFIHLHFHSNKNPNTDSWMVNFPHPVFNISRPIILIEFRQLTKAFIVTVWQICLFTILLLLIVGNWNLRCCQKYDVILWQSAGSTYEANGHTQTVW